MSEIQVGQINSTDGSTAITTGADGYVSFAKTQIGGRRNLIINGAMQVAQRGTSSTSGGYGSVDRFQVAGVNALDELAYTQSQSTDSPSGFSNSYKLEVTTPETSFTDVEYLSLRHNIEAQNLVSLAFGTSDAEKFTLSFWVKSSVTGTYNVNIYADGARNISQTYSISSANTWELKTLVFDGDPSGNITYDNTLGFQVSWCLSTGPDRATTDSTSWGAHSSSRENYGQTADVGGTTGATFQITGVQLEVGTVATPFEHRSYGEELALCQRYYQRVTRGSSDSGFLTVACWNGTEAYGGYRFPFTMRAAPTGSVSDTDLFYVYSSGNAPVTTAVTVQNVTKDTTEIFTQVSSGISGGNSGWLRFKTANGYIDFDAEL